MTPGIITLILLAVFGVLGGTLAYRANPEFRRCVWLEFALPRLAAMAVVLFAFFLLGYVIPSGGPRYTLTIAIVMFYLIPGAWGIFRVAYAIPEEIHNGTWDAQRLSGIGAWNLTWGKLLGATAFMWFGGLICIGGAIWASTEINPTPEALDKAIFDWILRIGCVLGGQAVALCVALAQIRKNRTSRNVRYPFMAGQLAMILVARLVGAMSVLAESSIGQARMPGVRNLLAMLWREGSWFTWYGLRLNDAEFRLITVGGLVALGLFGAWRLMRLELRYHVLPWSWPLFNLLAIVYVVGFVTRFFGNFMGPLLPLSAVVVPTLLILTYIGAFSEPKDFLRHRLLFEKLRQRDWRGGFALLPLWLPSLSLLLLMSALALFAVTTVPLQFCPIAGANPALLECPWIGRIYGIEPDELVTRLAGFIIALLMFLARDICVILFLNMAENPKQADLIAWLIMVLSYIVAPVIFGAIQYEWLLPLFLPLPMLPAWVTLPAALPGLLVAVCLLGWRWYRRQKRQIAGMATAAT